MECPSIRGETIIMTEFVSRENFQPCLLDRLTDDHPESPTEPPDQGIMSFGEFKQSVLRDLASLLNAKCPPPDSPIYDYDDAEWSVLSYGIPDFCGQVISHHNPAELENNIKTAIERFEPRIDPRSLTVRAITSKDARSVHAAIFEVEGMLWAYPAPNHIHVRTEVDFESGYSTVQEQINE